MLKRILTSVICLLLVLSFASCAKPQEVLQELAVTTTAIPTVRITFPEGMTVPEYAELLEKNGVCSFDDFINVCRQPREDYELVRDINDPQNRPFLLEGYLFPDTYEFFYDMDPQEVVKKFLDNLQSKFTAERIARASELGMTPDEVLSLASVIQEEATPEQMKTVSSVLHNRLDTPGGKLECDVTVFYLNDNVEPYVDDVTRYSELYNCYKRTGLPEGPITNVGTEAIDAALYPADTDYYFFLTDEDGGFHYAVTWPEHEANVNKYIK